MCDGQLQFINIQHSTSTFNNNFQLNSTRNKILPRQVAQGALKLEVNVNHIQEFAMKTFNTSMKEGLQRVVYCLQVQPTRYM